MMMNENRTPGPRLLFLRKIYKRGGGWGSRQKVYRSVPKVYRNFLFTLYYYIVFIIKYRNSVVSVPENDIYTRTHTRTRAHKDNVSLYTWYTHCFLSFYRSILYRCKSLVLSTPQYTGGTLFSQNKNVEGWPK